MKVTLSVIKADVGSIGGHTKPSERMMDAVRRDVAGAIERGLLIDAYISHTGDDIAMVMSHTNGEGHPDVHSFCWDAFVNATEIAKEYGLYGAGQDLLTDAPSGNVRGAGPAVAEIEMDHTLEPPRRRESVPGREGRGGGRGRCVPDGAGMARSTRARVECGLRRGVGDRASRRTCDRG